MRLLIAALLALLLAGLLLWLGGGSGGANRAPALRPYDPLNVSPS